MIKKILLFLFACIFAVSTSYGATINLDTDANGTVDLNRGGTNSSTASAARTALGLVIGTDVQAYSSNLGIYSNITPSAAVQYILSAASNAAIRALLDLEADVDFYSISAADLAFQPLDPQLTDMADGTLTGDFVNTDYPWADNEVSDTITVGASGSVNDAAIPSGVTRDTEWDSAAEINAATTDADFLTSEVDGSVSNEIEVVDEVYNATNFDGGTASAVSQDDFYDYAHISDTDDDGDIDVVDPTVWATKQGVATALTSISGLAETNGGIPYGTADNAYAWLAAGAEGTLLMGNGVGAPSWLAAGSAGQFLIGAGAADPVWTTQSTLASLEGLTIADVSILEGTAPDTLAVVTSGGADYILGSNSDNTALEFKAPGDLIADLSLVIGTDVQAQSANLDTFSGIAPSAYIQGMLAAGITDEATWKAYVGLVEDTDYYSVATADATFQPLSDDLTRIDNYWTVNSTGHVSDVPSITCVPVSEPTYTYHDSDCTATIKDVANNRGRWISGGDDHVYGGWFAQAMIDSVQTTFLDFAGDTQILTLGSSTTGENITENFSGTDKTVISSTSSVVDRSSAIPHRLAVKSLNSHTVAGVGTLSDVTSPHALLFAEVCGAIINNYSGTPEAKHYDLPAAAEGGNFKYILGLAQNVVFDPNGTETMLLNGAVIANAHVISNTAPAIGQSILFYTFQTTAGAWMWAAESSNIAFVDLAE